MDQKKNIYIVILLIFIPLLLLVLFYNYYVNYYVHAQCIIPPREHFSNNNSEEDENKEEQQQEVIEGFFGGLTNWFSTNVAGGMPISPGSLGDENLSILEKKISGAKKSVTFPPSTSELTSSSDDFKDTDNKDLLGSINSKALEKPFLTKNSVLDNTKEGVFKDLKTKPTTTSESPSNMNPEPKQNIKKDSLIAESSPMANSMNKTIAKENYTDIATSAESLLQVDIGNGNGNVDNIKNLLGSCQFFNDQCPKDYMQLGNFSVQGVDSSNYILTCGNVQNTTPAKAIAEIKNNSIYDIHITDKGRGFSPLKPPRVTISGGGGVNATAEAVIDDDGFLALIKVTSKGHSFIETPNVLIDPPMNDSSCHLCCKI